MDWNHCLPLGSYIRRSHGFRRNSGTIHCLGTYFHGANSRHCAKRASGRFGLARNACWAYRDFSHYNRIRRDIFYNFKRGIFHFDSVYCNVYFLCLPKVIETYMVIELTAYFTWAGTLPFFIYFPGLLQGIQGATMEANLSTIYLGIFPAAIAYVAWATALSLGETSSVASMLYAEPVAAIVVAWLWLREFPSTLSIVGGLIAISSVLIVNWIGIKHRPRTKPEMVSN